MTRRGATLAAFVALVVVLSGPASAGTSILTVADRHTDFGSGGEDAPTELTNWNIQGSGDDATLEIDNANNVATYVSDNFSTNGRPYTGHFINFSYENAAVSIEWQEDDDGDGNWDPIIYDGSNQIPLGGGNWTVNWTQSQSSGGQTFTTNVHHSNVRVNVTVVPQSGTTTATIRQEGVLVESYRPTIDDASATPTGNLSEEPTQLAVDVGDQDFPTNEQLTVEFSMGGSPVGTDTLNANGTASTSITLADDVIGRDWSVTVTDQVGLTRQSQTYHFESPGTLTLYEEQNPDTPFDPSFQPVVAELYTNSTSDPVVVRNISTGPISLAGLPANGDVVVELETVNPNRPNRRTYLPRIQGNYRAYVILEGSAYFNVFQLDDRSGQFDPESTVLQIDRALNLTSIDANNLTWQTVSGDYLGGPNQHKTYLWQDARHRLILRNDDTTRIVGAYYPTDEDNPKTIVVREIIVDPPEGEAYASNAWVSDSNKTDDEKMLWFTYSDPANETTSLDLAIYEAGNTSNVLDVVNVSDPGTEFSYNYQLTGVEHNTTWMVEWSAQRGGESIGGSSPVGGPVTLPLPMDPTWVGRFGIIAIPIVAGLSSERIATYGALGTVAFAGLLMLLGWVDISPALWWLAALTAGGAHAYALKARGGVVG